MKKESEKDDMNKELEALRRIKKSHFIAMSCLIGRNRDIETENALETIEQALKRNEPMKVEIGTLKHFKFPICPNCKTELNEYYKDVNKFCKICGQKLDWSDDKIEKEKEKK